VIIERKNSFPTVKKTPIRCIVNIVIPKDSFSMERILEPEVMDDREEAIEYDAMDFTEVNTNFAKEAVQLAGINARVLDVGTGTARIPTVKNRSNWRKLMEKIFPTNPSNLI